MVAGMSGSPVYIGNKLLGSLSYRIGQFSKEPDRRHHAHRADAGGARSADRRGADGRKRAASKTDPADGLTAGGMTFQAMETPLVMSGFRPEAIRLWQKKMAGTGLEMVAAGRRGRIFSRNRTQDGARSRRPRHWRAMEPGSAVSAQLIRGDLEISATCTVTYIDPKQLLACGHPILQAGPVSLPMTTADVVATLASPLNAFKIVNTGETIGAFTQDRDAAIRGVLGAKAHMIPVHVAIHERSASERKLNFEVLDLPSLTPQALMVALYSALLESNESTADTSYHLTGSIDLDGYPPSPLDLWAAGGDGSPAQLTAAMLTGERFAQLYSNGTRQGDVQSIDLRIEAIPRNLQVELGIGAGCFRRHCAPGRHGCGGSHSASLAAAGAERADSDSRCRRGWERAICACWYRMRARWTGLWISRALSPRPRILTTALAQARRLHPADRVYVSLLAPETQAEMEGQTLSGSAAFDGQCAGAAAHRAGREPERRIGGGGGRCTRGRSAVRLPDSESAH